MAVRGLSFSEISGEFVPNRDFECVGDCSDPVYAAALTEMYQSSDWTGWPSCYDRHGRVVGAPWKLPRSVRQYLEASVVYRPATLLSAHHHIAGGRLVGWCVSYRYEEESDIDDNC